MKMLYQQIKIRIIWVFIGLMIAVLSIFAPVYVVDEMQKAFDKRKI